MILSSLLLRTRFPWQVPDSTSAVASQRSSESGCSSCSLLGGGESARLAHRYNDLGRLLFFSWKLPPVLIFLCTVSIYRERLPGM